MSSRLTNVSYLTADFVLVDLSWNVEPTILISESCTGSLGANRLHVCSNSIVVLFDRISIIYCNIKLIAEHR